MPVIAQGRSEEELEKRLGAALLAGDPAISLDNCDHTLESAFLCQVLTQSVLNIRLLGHSKNDRDPAQRHDLRDREQSRHWRRCDPADLDVHYGRRG